jgi:hypothetical protein
MPNVGSLGTILKATHEEEAYDECRARKLWLYSDFISKGLSKREQENDRV